MKWRREGERRRWEGQRQRKQEGSGGAAGKWGTPLPGGGDRTEGNGSLRVMIGCLREAETWPCSGHWKLDNSIAVLM